MKRYDLRVETYKNTSLHFEFTSRKQAFVFVNCEMLMKNKYRYARLMDLTTGEIWMEMTWRGRDNYRRKHN
jgi:hypothetical protein